MSKKHFIALADAFRDELAHALLDNKSLVQFWRDVHVVSIVCKNANPAFNKDLWIAYIKGECGPSGGKV